MSAETELQNDMNFEFFECLDSEEAIIGYLEEGLTKEVINNYEKFAEELEAPYMAITRLINDKKQASSRLQEMVSFALNENFGTEPLAESTIKEVIQGLSKQQRLESKEVYAS